MSSTYCAAFEHDADEIGGENITRAEKSHSIFRVGTPFNRLWLNHPFLTGSLQSKQTLQETKQRKEFLSPFFSKSAISRVEPFLHRQKLSTFLSTLEASAVARSKEAVKESGEDGVVDFFLGFRCLTADTIMDYCFQQDLNSLAEPKFESKVVKAFIEGFDLALVPNYFPNFFGLVNKIIFALPEKVREKHFAPVHGFQTMQKVCYDILLGRDLSKELIGKVLTTRVACGGAS